MAESWANAPIVFVTLPACPSCGSIEYRKVRTESNGDGSRTRKAVCRGCGLPFKIVVELPEIELPKMGNPVWPVGIMQPESEVHYDRSERRSG
jgi:hypothetical protein